MNYKEELANQVGHVFNREMTLHASCFLISLQTVVTCYHAISGEENTSLYVEWPRLNIVRRAILKRNCFSSLDDVAFLELNEPIPQNTPILSLGVRQSVYGKFMSFGYRKNRYYDGLFSEGSLVGEIRTVDGRQLLQLNTDMLERGMSGAPVLDITQEKIVGMVCEYWATETRVDSSLAFAVPVSRLLNVMPDLTNYIPELIALPKELESGKIIKDQVAQEGKKLVSEDDFVRASLRLAVLVAADQFEDGSWGRSLWKETGSHLTSDVADMDMVRLTHEKKALSATSWAAQALAKASSNIYLPSVKKAIDYILAHYNRKTGAFGNIYGNQSNTPLVKKKNFIRSPRHTASGIKLLELANGVNRDVISGLTFILKNESSNGGWGETIGDSPNSLSTAYVLDALIRMIQIPGCKSLLPLDTAKSLTPAVIRGMTWLIEQRDDDGLWEYEDGRVYKPMYSANIIALVPQLISHYHDETIFSLNSLLAHGIDSGIPATMNGQPDFATTAMSLFAMLRTDPQYFEDKIQETVSWIVRNVLSDGWLNNYSCMSGIFGLTSLTQLPNISRKNLVPKLLNIFTDRYSVSASPDYWLDISQVYNLGIEKTIEELYLT